MKHNAIGKVGRVLLAALFIFSSLPAEIFAQEDEPLGWPREIKADKGTIIMYQPQIDSFSGDKLEARAAISMTATGKTDRVFGAIWMSSRVATDTDTRMVTFDDVKVTAVKFPEISEEESARLSALIETEIPKWGLTMSLDRLLASLEVTEMEQLQAQDLKHDAPKIYFATSPSVLVVLDGEPKLKEIEGSSYQYVANSPFFILFDPSRKSYYLKGGDWWYWSREVESTWETTLDPPKDVVEIAQKAEEEAKKNATEPPPEPDSTMAEITEPPNIIVTTVAAELIQSDGEPDYASVEGTQLLYMSNTENDVIMDISSQQYYVLLSGRWFTSKSLTDGEWAHVPPDQVPPDFAKIPEDSDMGNVLVAVAGTEQAQDAALENQIPQTAEVDRNATLTVEYDGEPRFDPIEGTDMKYAANTDKSVLLISGTYYCCSEAVWFTANSATGPWTVATSVPKDIQEIPPESPVYNVKYVYIYDSTPEVVYVGYTPGYVGSYYYGGCVVYGTGWHYRPWWGVHYYPRPVTYGFGVHWNPWTGWGFSFGVSYGWMTIRVGGPRYGWWGPGGYRHGYRHGYRRGYHHGRRSGYRAGYRAGQRNSNRNNMYRNRSGVRNTGTRASARPATRQSGQGTRATTGAGRAGTSHRATGGAGKTAGKSSRPNNVYTDKSGNVYRNQGDSWQKRDKNGWSSTDRSKGTTADRSKGSAADRSGKSTTVRSGSTYGASGANRSQSDLNRQQSARQQGTQRTNSYQKSRSSSSSRSSSASRSRSSGSRSGGGRSGGGRRR